MTRGEGLLLDRPNPHIAFVPPNRKENAVSSRATLLWSGPVGDRSRAEKGLPQRRHCNLQRQRALQAVVIGSEQQEPTLAAEPETYRGAFSGIVGRRIDEFESASPEPRRAEAP